MTSRTSDVEILIIGDAMLDIVAVPRADISDMDYAEASISFQAGGSGVNLALAASSAGFRPVSLVCSLGSDDFPNSRIGQVLRAAEVSPIINQVVSQPTGVSIVAYLNKDSRMMLAEPGVNSAEFASSVIDAACTLLPDILVVSGYMLYRPSTRNAVLRIMSHASDSGTMVALDVVPHSMHREFPIHKLRELLGSVNFVAAQKETLAVLDKEIGVLSFAKGFLEYEVGTGYRVVTRRGTLATGELQRPSKRLELRGMTDRLLISVLRDYFYDIVAGA